MNAPINSPIEALLTLEQAAKLLNISIRQVYRLSREGKIPVIMVSTRSPRINPVALKLYLESQTVNYGN